MEKYNFEGDISNVNERQLEFINKVILQLGFENSKILFEPVGIAGDNYAACVKRIIIEGENKKMSIIAKVAPPNAALREAMNSHNLFRNEHIMYTEVLPKLEQLQNEADIPEGEKLKYAKCYGSFSEPPNEVILLEDLKCSNFEMLDRFKSLSDECVKSVLKNFALLHSLSYVLRQKEPLTFDNYKTKLVNMWTSIETYEQIKMFFKGLEDNTILTLNRPEYDNLLRHKITNTLDQMLRLEKADKDSKYTVIHQGDSWTNNIMFRFEEGNLVESIMIDYQLSKNSSPVNDLLYMIFNCTDYEMRSKHFYDWIDYYHSELENSLSNYGLKVEFIYPRDRLDADLKRYGKLMFGFSIVLAGMLIRKSDDAAKLMEAMQSTDMSNIAEKSEEFGVSSLDEESIIRFKTRVVGLIKSFTEFGLL